MQALILVGGEGTRLRPLTYEMPKALIEVKGKPILEHILDNLKKYEVKDILLAVGHLSDSVISYFETGERLGLKIEYIIEDEKMGTGGPLKLAQAQLEKRFLVLNGDVLSKININDFLKFHENKKGFGTIALVEVDEPSHYGVVHMDGDRIKGFIEKPEKPPSNFINAGVYILEKKVLDYLPEGYSMVEKDLFPRLAEEGKLFGYKYNGPWYDVGTHDRLEKAKREWF